MELLRIMRIVLIETEGGQKRVDYARFSELLLGSFVDSYASEINNFTESIKPVIDALSQSAGRHRHFSFAERETLYDQPGMHISETCAENGST